MISSCANRCFFLFLSVISRFLTSNKSSFASFICAVSAAALLLQKIIVNDNKGQSVNTSTTVLSPKPLEK